MKWLHIIPCSKQKLDHEAPAWRMYSDQPCLALHLEYVRSRGNIAQILSAKYGFLRLNDRIQPYDLLLGQFGCVNRGVLVDQLIRQNWRPESRIRPGALFLSRNTQPASVMKGAHGERPANAER